jgi:phosphate transport system substrate-binding protein
MRYPWLAVITAGALAFGVAACGGDDDGDSGTTGGGDLSGPVAIDGSSTVFPFAQAAAEAFQGENPGAQVTVGESGTGGGFEKFCAGETDISNASRPIKEEEVEACAEGGVQYSEIQVANDGVAIVTNTDLEIGCMSTDQLKELWNKDSNITNYSQLGEQPDGTPFPDAEVSLYGPGTDSGTFDFFTDVINGEEGDTRKDYQPSEDDNVLVQGVQGDKGGLAYFGFSYYEDNQDKLNLVAVDSGAGCIKPSKETIQDESYKPLARPLFMYPSTASLNDKPQVKGFMDYTIANTEEIATTAKVVPLTDEQEQLAQEALAEAEAGAGTATTE